jgi:hypothetical protein
MLDASTETILLRRALELEAELLTTKWLCRITDIRTQPQARNQKKQKNQTNAAPKQKKQIKQNQGEAQTTDEFVLFGFFGFWFFGFWTDMGLYFNFFWFL